MSAMVKGTIRIRMRQNIINKVFPAAYTKLRPEDFTNIAAENKEILNRREYNTLINTRAKIQQERSCHEFFAKRGKNYIDLVPLEDESV